MKQRIAGYFPLRKLSIFALLLGLTLVINGCCALTLKQLEKFKCYHAENNYAWIASQEIDCKESCEGCNQLYLIKGDACLNLAGKGIEKEKNYRCAADHLEKGIGLTDKWEKDGDRAQTYENLCIALRELQDCQEGPEAIATGSRLLTAAEKFSEIEDGNWAAIYYLCLARFQKIYPDLIKAKPENLQYLCNELNQILKKIEDALAKKSPDELWNRYEKSYRDLQVKLLGEKDMLPNCQ